jgi:hypothetical protein
MFHLDSRTLDSAWDDDHPVAATAINGHGFVNFWRIDTSGESLVSDVFFFNPICWGVCYHGGMMYRKQFVEIFMGVCECESV